MTTQHAIAAQSEDREFDDFCEFYGWTEMAELKDPRYWVDNINEILNELFDGDPKQAAIQLDKLRHKAFDAWKEKKKEEAAIDAAEDRAFHKWTASR